MQDETLKPPPTGPGSRLKGHRWQGCSPALSVRTNEHTAVLPKIPHSNCCKRVPNRPLRGRRGRFGTLLQLWECGLFGRTAVLTLNLGCGPSMVMHPTCAHTSPSQIPCQHAPTPCSIPSQIPSQHAQPAESPVDHPYVCQSTLPRSSSLPNPPTAVSTPPSGRRTSPPCTPFSPLPPRRPPTLPLPPRRPLPSTQPALVVLPWP